jgi:hypothetical protein
MIDRHVAFAATSLVISRQHRNAFQQGRFAGAVFTGNDGDGPIEDKLEIVLQKRQAERIGLAIGNARWIEPDPFQVRRGHIDGAISP